MRVLSAKSGFKTVRDLILFTVGLSICLFHVATTYQTPDKLSIPLLLFGGGLAGSTAVLQRDERRKEDDGDV